MSNGQPPFADMVLAAMRRRGLGLRALCRLAQLDPSFLSKILLGKRSPPGKESILKKIAEILDLDAELLIVCAGKIPSAWEALWRDPELFGRVDSLARRKVASAPAALAASIPASRSRPRRDHPERTLPSRGFGGLSDELL